MFKKKITIFKLNVKSCTTRFTESVFKGQLRYMYIKEPEIY